MTAQSDWLPMMMAPGPGAPLKFVVCRLPDRARSDLLAVIFIRRDGHDDRSGIDRQSGLEAVPRSVQSVLQRPRRNPVAQPNLRAHASDRAKSLRRSAEVIRRN